MECSAIRDRPCGREAGPALRSAPCGLRVANGGHSDHAADRGSISRRICTKADYVGLFEYAFDVIDERRPALFCFVVEPQCEDARRASSATLLGT
jgi:hypothetical protein